MPVKNNEMTKFPYPSFPYRLDIKERVCWFSHEEDLYKLIVRENLDPKDYKISTNGVELVGKVPRTKRRKKQQRSRRSSSN